MTRRILTLAAVLAVAASTVIAQTPPTPTTPAPVPKPPVIGPAAHVSILVPKISALDADNHTDLTPGIAKSLSLVVTDAQGRTISSYAVHWASGNASIAQVTQNGVVVGKSRGYATIAATVGTVTATVRACVSPKARLDLHPEIVRVQKVVAAPPSMEIGNTSNDGVFAFAQYLAKDTTSGSTGWGSCVHWFVGAAEGKPVPDTAQVQVDHAGMFRIRNDVTMLYPGASIGTVWPVWVPRSVTPPGSRAN